jgi:sugar/nucleoside kinase (ribokinase family)
VHDSDASKIDDEQSEVLTYLNTAVGDDDSFGRQLKKNLQQNGVDISGIGTLSDGKTGTYAVFVEKFTGDSWNIGFPGASINWTPRHQDSVECLTGGRTPDLIVAHL